MKNQPYASTVTKWLRDNGHRLGGLTSGDTRALLAAVQIVPLWSPYSDRPDIAAAWGACVRQMQPEMRQYAFHAVAHVLNWEDRQTLWLAAGFAELPQPLSRCIHEPSTRHP